jgi:hypothetical protein
MRRFFTESCFMIHNFFIKEFHQTNKNCYVVNCVKTLLIRYQLYLLRMD